jgi:hypothetical protein
MTRNQAMERMALEQRSEPAVYKQFIKELGIRKKDINDKAEWSK